MANKLTNLKGFGEGDPKPDGAKSKALKKKTSSFEGMNKARKSQGYAPNKDRATKGLYDFLDK